MPETGQGVGSSSSSGMPSPNCTVTDGQPIAATCGVFVKLGGTAAPPSTGSHADGAWLMPGVTYSLFVQTAAALHGIMVAGSATGKLRITKVR